MRSIRVALETADRRLGGLPPRMITDITPGASRQEGDFGHQILQIRRYQREETYESSNLYQLHAYVSQLRRQALHPEGNRNSRPHPHDHCAEGVLLYATVDEKDFVHRFDMPPHQMTVATVNLARGWRSRGAKAPGSD